MQDHILANHRSAKMRVYALWTDKLFFDSRDQWDTGGLVDRRVVHLWDGKDVAGGWFVNHLPSYQGGDWDAYLLFGPQAVWTTTPHPLRSSGSPVIGTSDQLQASIAPLLPGSRHPSGGR